VFYSPELSVDELDALIKVWETNGTPDAVLTQLRAQRYFLAGDKQTMLSQARHHGESLFFNTWVPVTYKEALIHAQRFGARLPLIPDQETFDFLLDFGPSMGLRSSWLGIEAVENGGWCWSNGVPYEHDQTLTDAVVAWGYFSAQNRGIIIPIIYDYDRAYLMLEWTDK
jgi:hypothetical protein